MNLSRWDKRQHTEPKVLGQIKPGGTTAVTIYTVPENTETEVKEISIVNLTNQDKDFAIYIDDNGSTYDDNTIVASNVINKQIGEPRTFSITMDKEGGSIGVQSSSSNDINFTITGIERPKR